MVPACAGRPAVAQIKSGIPAKSLPLVNFVFIPPPDPDKNSILWRAGEKPRIGGYWSLCDPDGGIFTLAWRIPSPAHQVA